MKLKYKRITVFLPQMGFYTHNICGEFLFAYGNETPFLINFRELSDESNLAHTAHLQQQCYKTLSFRVPHSITSRLCDDCFDLRSDTFEKVFCGFRWFPTQCSAPLCLAACIMAKPGSLSHVSWHQSHQIFRYKNRITPKYFCASSAVNGVGSGLFPLPKSYKACEYAFARSYRLCSPLAPK